MKKPIILVILFLLWIGASISAFLLIDKYIENKDNRLRREIRKKIENLFVNQSAGGPIITLEDGFFDSPMNGMPVKNYKKASIPAKPSKSTNDYYGINEALLEDWKNSYGDVASLWDLNWGDANYRNIGDEGWQIVGTCCIGGRDDEFIRTIVLFPYRVALKKIEWGNHYSVPQAVSEAYDFFTSDSKSGISDRFEIGSHSRLWSKIYDCENEYYGIHRVENYHSRRIGNTIPGGISPKEGGPVECTWMHNGYFRVYIAVSQEAHYGISKHGWNPDIEERNKLLLWWLSGIAIIFLVSIIIVCVKIHKDNKIKSETLKHKLLRLCSPKAFMNPYNKELVDKANILYPKIVDADSKEGLISCADEAQELLGVALVSSLELSELKKLADPANFTKPYNAEKISAANEIFSILSQPQLKYSDFVAAKKQIKELYK